VLGKGEHAMTQVQHPHVQGKTLDDFDTLRFKDGKTLDEFGICINEIALCQKTLSVTRVEGHQ